MIWQKLFHRRFNDDNITELFKMWTRVTRAWKRRVWIHVLRVFHPKVEINIGGRRICADVRDAIIGSLLYVHQEYETTIENLIASLEIEGSVCLDIGANIGLHTTLLSQLVGPAGKVFAFEPEPANSDLLRTNLKLNDCRNVEQIRAAVGDRAGTCRLRLNPSNFGDHRVASSGSEDGCIVVPVETIDASLDSLSPGVMKLIKIDVQGYEARVLRGMVETLRRNPAVVLIMEVFPEGLQQMGSSAAALMEVLRELDFQGWEVHDFRLIPLLEPWTYDLIRGGKYVDIVVSRDSARLDRLVGQYLKKSLPPCDVPLNKFIPAPTQRHA